MRVAIDRLPLNEDQINDLVALFIQGAEITAARMGRNVQDPHRPSDSYRKHRSYLLERDSGRCVYCGTYLDDDVTIDHVVPVVKGGSDDPYNLVIACRNCNSKKGARTPKEAGMPFLDFLPGVTP